MYVCADCSALEGVVVMPVKDNTPEDAGMGVDYCPACGDYLSLLNMGEVEVDGVALFHLRERTFGGGPVE